MVFNPAFPQAGYYTGKPLTDDELAEHNRRAEASRKEARRLGLLTIGLDADGQPFKKAEAAAEVRLLGTDQREPLRQAHRDLAEVSARVDELLRALDRARAHAERLAAGVRAIEEGDAAAEAAAREGYAARLGAGEDVVLELPAARDLTGERRVLLNAEMVADAITAKLQLGRNALGKARARVEAAAREVLRVEGGMRLAHEIAEDARTLEQKRSNLYALGNLGIPFSRSMTDALVHTPPPQPSAPTVDWGEALAALIAYPDAELSYGLE
jgi:hypothetical protein